MAVPLQRRWFQFTLRRLLGMVTLLCGMLAALWHFEIAPAERQRAAVLVVQRLGGKAMYGNSPEDSSWPVRQLRKWLPRDYFDPVGVIELDGTLAGDADLAHFRGLNKLRILYLRGTQVTDAGLVHLQDAEELVDLDLSGTKVTDGGLTRLQKLLSLGGLFLDETAVTDAGMAHLRELPNLQDLSLRNTSVTNSALPHLSAFPHLQSLDLEGTLVTDAGIATFRESSREYVIIRGLSKPIYRD